MKPSRTDASSYHAVSPASDPSEAVHGGAGEGKLIEFPSPVFHVLTPKRTRGERLALAGEILLTAAGALGLVWIIVRTAVLLAGGR